MREVLRIRLWIGKKLIILFSSHCQQINFLSTVRHFQTVAANLYCLSSVYLLGNCFQRPFPSRKFTWLDFLSFSCSFSLLQHCLHLQHLTWPVTWRAGSNCIFCRCNMCSWPHWYVSWRLGLYLFLSSLYLCEYWSCPLSQSWVSCFHDLWVWYAPYSFEVQQCFCCLPFDISWMNIFISSSQDWKRKPPSFPALSAWTYSDFLESWSAQTLNCVPSKYGLNEWNSTERQTLCVIW